jgi:hypothetical protein
MRLTKYATKNANSPRRLQRGSRAKHSVRQDIGRDFDHRECGRSKYWQGKSSLTNVAKSAGKRQTKFAKILTVGCGGFVIGLPRRYNRLM